MDHWFHSQDRTLALLVLHWISHVWIYSFLDGCFLFFPLALILRISHFAASHVRSAFSVLDFTPFHLDKTRGFAFADHGSALDLFVFFVFTFARSHTHAFLTFGRGWFFRGSLLDHLDFLRLPGALRTPCYAHSLRTHTHSRLILYRITTFWTHARTFTHVAHTFGLTLVWIVCVWSLDRIVFWFCARLFRSRADHGSWFAFSGSLDHSSLRIMHSNALADLFLASLTFGSRASDRLVLLDRLRITLYRISRIRIVHGSWIFSRFRFFMVHGSGSQDHLVDLHSHLTRFAFWITLVFSLDLSWISSHSRLPRFLCA